MRLGEEQVRATSSADENLKSADESLGLSKGEGKVPLHIVHQVSKYMTSYRVICVKGKENTSQGQMNGKRPLSD